MLFNSTEFLFFLPVVFLLYWLLYKYKQVQNLFILVVSYIFYGWWDWTFLFLIALTSAFSFGSGILIEYFADNRTLKKITSAANIVLNLSILGLFKYYNFFTENLVQLLGSIGWSLDIVTLNVILPVGISFYTFQALSYTIDVYRGNIKATHNIVEFFAFISFFPQLVAGPIERATNLLPQFQKNRVFDYSSAVDGTRQMLWGFFKKVVIADTCAGAVDFYWGSYSNLPGFSLIILGVLFTIQIYCDFSGYSDIAIGCSRLFGFNLMRNFNVPYFSRSIPEFWRRWHISLTTWFRDYIYFPLGGSRCSKIKTIRNVFIVWGISGLWHGANWTFVVWGLYHATCLAIYNLLGINTKYKNIVAHGRLLPNIRESFQMILTFFLAVFGWIIFRAKDLSETIDYFNSMLSNKFFDSGMIIGLKPLLTGILLLLVEWVQRDKQHALQINNSGLFRFIAVRYALYIVIAIFVIIYFGTNQTFIYFQF